MKNKGLKNKKLVREIYDKNYYKAQELLRNPWFRKKILWLKNEFKEVGCPIPKEGFKTLKEYLSWADLYWKTRGEIETSPAFKEKIAKITGGKDSWGTKEMRQIENLRLKFLPPIYGEVYDEILEKFNIDRKNKGFRDFLERHIFFNKNKYFTPSFSINWIRSQKTDKMELFIKLNGHTRKEDVINGWNFIANEQKDLPDYTGKNKKWINFKRDNEIYDLYIKLKSKRGKRAEKYEGRIDEIILNAIQKKGYDLSFGSIRSIISRIKKSRVASKEAD